MWLRTAKVWSSRIWTLNNSADFPLLSARMSAPRGFGPRYRRRVMRLARRFQHRHVTPWLKPKRRKEKRITLSAGHANSPGTGCVCAALGPELARKPVAVRRKIEALLETYRERLLPFMPGQTREEKQSKIRLLFPSMAGVLMMARVSSDPQRREQILMEARNFFTKCFAEEQPTVVLGATTRSPASDSETTHH